MLIILGLCELKVRGGICGRYLKVVGDGRKKIADPHTEMKADCQMILLSTLDQR